MCRAGFFTCVSRASVGFSTVTEITQECKAVKMVEDLYSFEPMFKRNSKVTIILNLK